jgi:hypothetical protein
MIDWFSVAFNALWILGLGFVLATLSFANYMGSGQRRGFRQALNKPACRIMIDLGLVMFCLGLLGIASALWERLLWALLALAFAVQLWPVRKKSIA